MVPWIQVYSNILTHDKTYTLAERLKIPNYAAVGLMVSLWCWAAINAADGDITRYPPRAIAEAAGWNKKPVEFYKFLLEIRLIEQEKEKVLIRNWERYASLLMEIDDKQKRQSSERVKRYRDKKRNADCNGDCNVTVTPSNAPTVPNLTVPNQYLSDDGDGARVVLQEQFFGMTPETEALLRGLAAELIPAYWGRQPTEWDVCSLCKYGTRREWDDAGTPSIHIDGDKLGLMKYAFQASADAGVRRWDYIDGILARCSRRGLHTADACELYDAKGRRD